MIRIVLDTNVLVSGMLNPDGAPGRVVDLIRAKMLQTIVDDRILADYRDVLSRDYSASYFSETDQEDILGFLRSDSIHIVSAVVVKDLPDMGDIPFLEVARAADAVLITGNCRHFPVDKRQGCVVVSPAEFIDRFF